MATSTVKKGDTMWSIVSRDLEKRTGKKPTNAEISRALKVQRVPGSGDKNKIKPGENISLIRNAGGGSEARGPERSDKNKSTTMDRRRAVEQAASNKARKSRPADSMRKFRESERASSGRGGYRAPGSADENRRRIQEGNKKKTAPKKKATTPGNYRAPGSAAENRARIEASRPKKKKSTVMARANTTAYARSKAR
jgi:hypothetical protein